MKGPNFYNEIDPYAAQWLRNLIAAGHIAPGVVDERSIEDIYPEELHGYTQCHFFAGVGVWSLALRRAGWPDDRPIWTGSCPCQPFSAAGQGNGFDDKRHLWPHFHYLIEQCKPECVLGEQVASRDADPWIDLVHTDMEALGYAFGAIPFPSAGVGAPHIRDRLYWVANADGGASGQRGANLRGGIAGSDAQSRSGFGGGGVPVGLANTVGAGSSVQCGDRGEPPRRAQGGGIGRLGYPAGAGLERLGCGGGTRQGREGAAPERAGTHGGLADADGRDTSAEWEQRGGEQRQQPQDGGRSGLALGVMARPSGQRCDGQRLHIQPGQQGSAGAEVGRGSEVSGPGPTNGYWAAADWLGCRDGKWRPVEPGTFPLAHGAASRVGRLRAYGNAINAEAARVFIEAVMESL